MPGAVVEGVGSRTDRGVDLARPDSGTRAQQWPVKGSVTERQSPQQVAIGHRSGCSNSRVGYRSRVAAAFRRPAHLAASASRKRGGPGSVAIKRERLCQLVAELEPNKRKLGTILKHFSPAREVALHGEPSTLRRCHSQLPPWSDQFLNWWCRLGAGKTPDAVVDTED